MAWTDHPRRLNSEWSHTVRTSGRSTNNITNKGDMKPTKIKRLVTTIGYNNVSLEGEIEDGETIEEADQKLMELLSKLVDDDRIKYRLMQDSKSLQYTVNELKEDCRRLEEFKQKHLEFFEQAGKPFEDILNSDIPF
jgi:hypothetical protein